MSERIVLPSSPHGQERLQRLRDRVEYLNMKIRSSFKPCSHEKAEVSALVWAIAIITDYSDQIHNSIKESDAQTEWGKYYVK